MLNDLDMQNEILDALQPEADEGEWRIDSMEKADWALGKINIARKKMQQNADYVQAQVEKLQAWLEKQNQEQESTIAFFEGKLAPYLEDELKGGKKKSIKLPNGTAGFRKTTKTVKNDKILFDFVKENYTTYIKQVEKLDMAEFKKVCHINNGKLVTEDGAIVPGYEVFEENTLYTKD